MKKLAFIDIGELGWSMYIQAHVRWRKQNNSVSVAVITYPDRQCLYESLADIVRPVSAEFYTLFNAQAQNCLGIQKVSPETLREFFNSRLPADYSIPGDFNLTCKFQFGERLDFMPYKYSKTLAGREEVLVFPRHRIGGSYTYRNLKDSFYIDLIKRLCDEFPDLNIRTIGTTKSAYNIALDKPNYINYVGKGDGLQDMIDRCQLAVAAVGGQSGPPKIALLQGVPTFMIGHQKQRHIKGENWMRTTACFYSVSGTDYKGIDAAKCIEETVTFIKSNKRKVHE